MTADPGRAPSPAADVTSSTQAQLTMSYAGAADVAANPAYAQYAAQITAAAKQSFLDGDQLAYIAGIIAVLLGAALVFLKFPRHDEEKRLLSGYHASDVASMAAKAADTPPVRVGAAA